MKVPSAATLPVTVAIVLFLASLRFTFTVPSVALTIVPVIVIGVALLVLTLSALITEDTATVLIVTVAVVLFTLLLTWKTIIFSSLVNP